jgi:hypothetical protein
MLIRGIDLTEEQKAEVLETFTLRQTHENAKRSYFGQCPACVQNRLCCGSEFVVVDGIEIAWHDCHKPLQTDEEWLKDSSFHFVKDGSRLISNRKYCEKGNEANLVKFSNPRLLAEIEDFPIGSGNRGKCIFRIQNGGKWGVRATRTTMNKHGLWCKPKVDTYCEKAAIVDGDDGKTYVLSLTRYSAHISIRDSAFMSAGTVFGSDESYPELLALINEAKS